MVDRQNWVARIFHISAPDCVEKLRRVVCRFKVPRIVDFQKNQSLKPMLLPYLNEARLV